MERVGRFRFKCKRDSVQHLYQITDVHLLSMACAQNKFEEYIYKIKNDPAAIVIGTGDYIEGIAYNDIRFSPSEVPVKVRVCDLADYGKYSFDMVYDLLKPIASKIVALGFGNHEYVLLDRTKSPHLWKDLVARLGCKDLQYTGMLDLIFNNGHRDHNFRVAAHHGAGWAQKPGGVAIRLEDFMSGIDSDIFLMGHLHKQMYQRLEVVGCDPSMTKIISTHRLGVVGGSFLRTYTEGVSTYAEKRGYKPTPLGNPCITIQPETRQLGVQW